MAVTHEEYIKARKAGATKQQAISGQYQKEPKRVTKTEPKTEGIASKIFRGITEPVVTMLARPYQAAKSGISFLQDPTKEPDLDVNLPYYGTIKAPETWTDVRKDVGRGVQTVALGVGGAAPGAIKGAARVGLLSAAKQGAIRGATIGGLYGAGSGLEETGTVAGAAKGAAIGATGGAAIGFSTPFLAKAVKGVYKTATGGLKKTGEKVAGFTIRSPQKELKAIINYNAYKPTFKERMSALFTGKKIPTQQAPITTAQTFVRRVGPGREIDIAANAKRAQNELWNKVIDPSLKKIDDRVDMRKFLAEVRKEIIKEADLSRKNQLLKAFNSFNKDYSKVSNITYSKLQNYKSGWAKFLPEKTYRGEPIAAALKEVKSIAADKARNMIYDKVSPEVKTAYMDWGNLSNLIDEAIKTRPTPEIMSISRFIWQSLLDNVITPVTTVAGKTVYKIGSGLEFIGDAGAKKLGDIIGWDFFSPRVFNRMF